jgi:hypothetical protein
MMRSQQQAETVTAHLYRAGQRVRFTRGFPYRNAADNDYEVLHQLPSRDGECQYRIKSSHEPHERVVREGEIDPA